MALWCASLMLMYDDDEDKDLESGLDPVWWTPR
jgi:hypothetical protein